VSAHRPIQPIPSHRRSACGPARSVSIAPPSTRRRRSEASSRTTHPQLGKRRPDILLEPIRKLSPGPGVSAACSCPCHRVLTMAKLRLARPIPKPWLGGPPPSRSLGSARGSCGRSMSSRASPRQANRDGRRAKSEGRRAKGERRRAKGKGPQHRLAAGLWRARGARISKWQRRRCEQKKGRLGWVESSL
jgi:hypothetical protein